jgi:hypothetical protein
VTGPAGGDRTLLQKINTVVAGVDLGAHEVNVLLTNPHGNEHARRSRPLDSTPHPRVARNASNTQ